MESKKLTDELSVASQIAVGDVAAIKAQGFRSIVCHRPDGEAPDQPPFSEIEQAAEAAGLTVRHQPVVPGKISVGDVEAFAALLQELPKPVLAFCRTGARSTSLWQLTEASKKPLFETPSAAKAVS